MVSWCELPVFQSALKFDGNISLLLAWFAKITRHEWLCQVTLESLREELSSREKGRRSYLRGRLKTLRKQDLISLGEAGQLCVDELGKEQLVDLLMEYLVPEQEGETTPQRVWRILGEFWQERTSLECHPSHLICNRAHWMPSIPLDLQLPGSIPNCVTQRNAHCTRHLLRQTPFHQSQTTFTPDTFYTSPRQLLHQTLLTPDTFYTKHLLHQSSMLDWFCCCKRSYVSEFLLAFCDFWQQDEVLQLLPPRRSCLHFVVMPNDLWYSQTAPSLKATRWTVPPWLWLRISMWRFSHCCNKVAMIVTGREEACLCRILDCWENQITLPSWKDLCCRYCFASRCDMKAPKITSSFCGIGFDCARFRVRRRTAVAGASRTAALIYARMLNTLQRVVGKGSGETLSSRWHLSM